MEFNDILMIVGAAVCILPVTYMLGYARHEKQATDEHTAMCKRIEADNKRINAIADAAWQGALTLEREAVRELEISLLKAGEALELEENAFNGMKSQWAYADKYRKAVVSFMLEYQVWDFNKHADDPREMLRLLCLEAQSEALDMSMSKAAKNLHTRGVRKGAARGRKQMAKLMQKSIDNQAQTINEYSNALQASRARYGQFVLATRNVLDDKIALPSVRRALRRAISVEVTRIRAVEGNKGA